MKSIQIWVFSGPYFPAFGLNTERYGVSPRIQSECRKILTRKNSVFGHSRSVYSSKHQFCKYRMGYIWEKLLVKHLNWRRDTNISREVFRAIIFKKKIYFTTSHIVITQKECYGISFRPVQFF